MNINTGIYGLLFATLVSLSGTVAAGDGKLLATPGVTQLEGSAGGGLVPWATLAGYATEEQNAVSAFATQVSVNDYRLTSLGAAVNWQDRVEFSVARQTFNLKSSGQDIRQLVYGGKVRVYGDIVYSDWPQLSLGWQHKRLLDEGTANAVGASFSDEGNDLYLAATKLHLAAVGGYNLLWNLTARMTRANQLGLLGFGGDKDDSHSLQLEASAAILFSRRLAVGLEYRQKPDNLSFAREDDWMDVFVAWFPSKDVNLTLAWTDLGSIAGEDSQNGPYASLTGYLW